MEHVPLTYERLKAAQEDLTARYKEYVPKMWITRKLFEPQFDMVTVGPPVRKDTLATVNLCVIERGAGFNTMPKWYTKMIHYAIHPEGFAEPLALTAWGQMPEATAYKGALDDWIDALQFRPKAVEPKTV